MAGSVWPWQHGKIHNTGIGEKGFFLTTTGKIPDSKKKIGAPTVLLTNLPLF